MAEDDLRAQSADDEVIPRPAPRRRRWLILAIAGGILLVLFTAIWFQRKDIADNFVAGQLEAMNVPATYEIESIGPRRQVIRNVVVGDPGKPDLTVDRIEVTLRMRWGVPAIGRITVVKPRLYGTYRNDKLSFGSLDPVIFAETKEPSRLPDYDIAIRDGRGLLESDYGPVGVKIEGAGHLRGGFSGSLAALTPDLAVGGCKTARASIFGRVTVKDEHPRFVGPLRLAALRCEGQDVQLGRSDIELDVTGTRTLDGAEGRLRGKALGLIYGASQIAGAGANARFAWRKGVLTTQYAMAGVSARTPQAELASLSAEGMVRMTQDFSRIEAEGDVKGTGLSIGSMLDSLLASAQRSGEGSLLAPLAAQVRAGLQREGRDSNLAGNFLYRGDGNRWSLTVPNARVNGTSGKPLLALSRLQLGLTANGVPQVSGNFSTGGEGLPRITGRMEAAEGGQLALGVTMAEYGAGNARVELPRLALVQSVGGALGFSGMARLTGDVPGGRVENLEVPLSGNWSSASGLSLWRRCVPLRFDSLAFANLALQRQSLTLCAPPGQAIVRTGPAGTRIAAGASAISVVGKLGESPIRIASGPIGFAWPGQLSARSLAVQLGPEATASHFRITNLSARIGSDIAGKFSGSDIMLGAVPLDLREASGDWRYAGGKLAIANAAFRLFDRQPEARFEPLTARGASLTLVDNRIAAAAALRDPVSDRLVVRTDIHHDVGRGAGDADLFVDGLVFDEQLQPDRLTRQALGVVANARGTLRGTGRIDWTPDTVTSTGRFTTDSLDFAAAFGPVKGLSGEIIFTDLLGLVTAPDQTLHVDSINPGIEVLDGDIVFDLKAGYVVDVKGGQWPFLGGTLEFQPITMNIGKSETWRYVLEIEGVDAAKFLERMDLANITATGVFDGTIPLVFDDKGGRVEGGMLRSRSPGGSVSYVGALSYKDLSPMANFAFDALKSLDYSEMTVGLDGPLEGEIVTRVRLHGVKQGAGTRRNFITQRFANLPIRFDINLRAPFYQLISSFKSFYDPSFVRDPRELGLLDDQGRPIRNESANPPLPAITPEDIQRLESGNRP